MTDIHRWGELSDDGADAVFEEAAHAVDVTLEPNARGTEIAETPRRVALEVASAAVLMSGPIYKFTLDQTVFGGQALDPTTVKQFAIAVDTVDNEIDWLLKSGLDLYWGESTAAAVPVTVPGAKFVGEEVGYVDVLFDGAAMQCVTFLQTGGSPDLYKARYARLNEDGTVEQAPTNKFAPDTDRRYHAAALARRGSTLYWILSEEVCSSGFGALEQLRLRLAKTDLSGTVTMSPVLVSEWTGVAASASRNEAAIDSGGFLHVLHWPSGAHGTYYVKLDGSGNVLAKPAAVKFAVPSGWDRLVPIGMFADSLDRLHAVLMASRSSTDGVAFFYARLDTAGTVVVPETQFYAYNGRAAAAAVMHPTRNEIYIARPEGAGLLAHLMRLEPVSADGHSLGALSPGISL